MKDKLDKQLYGILLGLILPPITTFVFYSVRYYGDLSFFEFLQALFGLQSLGKLLSICVLPNLFVFLIAMKINYLWIVRGIIIATVVFFVAGALFGIIAKFD
ncbi:MAG: hypothetical protein FWH18_04425 [Marinilabiliaceae bacterium]|nr:hypothetical protein [Marinilabiliaceae bacterium]